MEHISNITFEENKRMIENIPLFSSVDVNIKSKILNHLYKEIYINSKPIFLKGDMAHSIYFIREGV